MNFQSKDDSKTKPSLQEIMQKGREAKKAQEQREGSQDAKDEGDRGGEITEKKSESGSDSEDDLMLIAGLSEVVS